MADNEWSLLATWVRTRQPRPAARFNLVCLPHAGGSASFYRDWGRGLSPEVEAHVVQYPGREERLAEPCVETMTGLADEVADAIRPLFGRPLVLFGHSMGAVLAYEVARRCEARGLVPELFIASGSPAPHLLTPRTLHLQDDDSLVAELRRYETTSSAVLDDPELREMLLPMIRADYKVIETYSLPEPVPVRTPLAVFLGVDDPDVDEQRALAWREVAGSGEIRHCQVFEGDHFYLCEHQDQVLASIASLVGVPPAAGPSRPPYAYAGGNGPKN